MEQNMILGIDPGLTGGLCLMSTSGIIINNYLQLIPIIKGKKIEYDINKLVEYFLKIKNNFTNCTVYLERAQLIPVSGSKSISSTFYGNGLLQGIIASIGFPYQIVRARDWQKKVFIGMDKQDTKQASVLFCARKYPDISFLPTNRCKNASHGLTDAVCIATYGRMIYGQTI